MSKIVVDASAILALAFGEAGSDSVQKARPEAIVSAVNHLEVLSKLLRTGMPIAEITDFLEETFPHVIPFDRQQSIAAAKLHAHTREHRLSYADCACLALAQCRNLPVLTGDRKWRTLGLNLEILLIR